MYFSGSADCPSFAANRFRKNFCSVCQSSIQDHSGASDIDVANAIEYSADKVPSLILRRQNDAHDGIESCLYMGGFKSAVNLDFLKNHHIGLIICAAKDLAQTFGPKYQRQLEKRSQELPQIKVVTVPWIDTPQQVLDETTFEQALLSIFQCQSNVLVHCAQGKSRSGVICIGFLALIKPTVTVEDLAKEVKSRRGMAEPNYGFMQQLIKLQKDGFFTRTLELATRSVTSEDM